MRHIVAQTVLALLTLAAPISSYAQTDEMEQNMFESMRENSKAAVVAVHTGAVDAVTLQRMDRFNDKLRQAFPQCEFREAWTSRKLADGSGRSTPDELLQQLKKEGFTHVLVQSSDIANGTEMQCLRSMVEAAKDMFMQIRLGEPLLYSTSDYEKVIDLAAKAYGTMKTANVLLCTGSTKEEESQLALLEYMMRDKGLDNWHVGTTNGYPSVESLARQLKASKTKKVHIIPFSFSDSEQEIATKISEVALTLKEAGYKVTAEPKCVGDIDGIIDLYEQHCKHAENFRSLTAKEKLLLKK